VDGVGRCALVRESKELTGTGMGKRLRGTWPLARSGRRHELTRNRRRLRPVDGSAASDRKGKAVCRTLESTDGMIGSKLQTNTLS